MSWIIIMLGKCAEVNHFSTGASPRHVNKSLTDEVDKTGAYYTEWSKPERKTPIQHQMRSNQSLSRVWLFATPWIAVRQASLSITNSQSSLRLTSIESVMPSSHLILCHPLLLLPQSLPASESFPMSQLY